MEKLQKRISNAKITMLIFFALTIINTVLIVINSNVIFPFSCFVSQMVTGTFAVQADETGDDSYLVIGVVLSLLIALVYFVLWLLAKKKNGFMTVALVLVIIDSLAVALVAVATLEVDILIDIAFHIWAVVDLALGISAAAKLKKMPEQPEFVPDIHAENPGGEYVFTNTAESSLPEPGAERPIYNEPSADSEPIGFPAEKGRILLSAEYNGMNVEVKRSKGLTELIVNGMVYAEKRGIIETEYSISARVSGVLFMTSFTASSVMYLYADGKQIAKKFRLY